MKSWIDNTGLHDVGKMLEDKRVKNLPEIEGLLQFCEMIIFSDKIMMSNYDDSQASVISDQIVQNLNKLGVTDDIFIVTPEDSNSFYAASEGASKEFAEDLKFGFHKIEKDISALRPRGIGSLNDEVSFIDYVTQNLSEKDFEEIREEHRERKISGVTHYLFAADENLREEVKKLVEKQTIDPNDRGLLFQLNAYLRYYINNSLAYTNSSFYTPSVSRARLAREVNNSIVDNLKAIMDEARLLSYKNQKIDVPTLTKALVENSKGNVVKMIELSLKYRESARSIRKWIDKKINHDNHNNTRKVNELKNQLSDLKSAFFASINLEETKNSKNAFTKISISIPFEFVKVNLTGIKSYINRMMHRRRINILNEITNDSMKSNLFRNADQLIRIFN
jgi:hypothetical protein